MECDSTTFLANMAKQGRGTKGNNSEPLAVESNNDSDQLSPTGNNAIADPLSAILAILNSGEKLDSLRGHIDTRFGNVDDRFSHFERRIFELETHKDESNKKIDAHESTIRDLRAEIVTLKALIATITNSVDDVEMASRKPYLVVSNIPVSTDKNDEEQFIELCNDKLHLNETITKEHIADVTRMKSNKRNESDRANQNH